MRPKNVRAVDRAIDLLEVIENSSGHAGVTEISQALGLPKSTVHRLLQTLVGRGLVRKNEKTEAYSLGYKILELSFAASRHWDIISIAMPHLEALRDLSGETAALALKIGRMFTYVAQVASLKEHRINPTLGRHQPLHWTGTGKAILAFVPADELEICLQYVRAYGAAEKTVTDTETLLKQLEQVRTQDYAVSFSERYEGASAIAAPIRDNHGVAQAAACIVAPETRVRQMDIPSLGQAVLEVSRRIEMACMTSGSILSALA